MSLGVTVSAMRPERNSVTELKWWISSAASLLAVLVPFLLVGGVITALNDPASTDRFNVVIGLGIYGPVQTAVQIWPFIVSAALGVRLLVPTFAGVHPRVVAMICTAWPIALGSYLQNLEPLVLLPFVAVAVLWALVMPLPRNSLMAYGPVRGGLILGLGLGTLAFQFDGLFLAIVWCAWRLYKNHPIEVAATAICTAVLPMLLIFDDFTNHAARPYQVLEITLLVIVALASLVVSQFHNDSSAETEPDAD
jgi:hypothetical protein